MGNEDRANPIKNVQLRMVLISILTLGITLSIGVAIQGVRDWWVPMVFFTCAAGFTWFMTYVLRNNE